MTRRIAVRQALLAALLLLGSALSASVTWPNLMNYQGQLTDSSGNAVADGTYSVHFALYTSAAAPSAIWSENQTVTVSKGLFNAILGSTTGQGLSILSPSTFNSDLWLGLTVNSDAEMTPRQQLLGPVNANNAQTVGGLLPNNAANNLVVLDGSGKIPAGLIQGGSIQFPLAMSGSSTFGLSLVNSNSASSAIGLSVVASSGIEAWATDPNGSALAGFSGSSTGYAVSGTNTAAAGIGIYGAGLTGVEGVVNQSTGTGTGVSGLVTGTAASGSIAVLGVNYLGNGTGVVGRAFGSGPGQGVRGLSLGNGGIGVYGTVSATGGSMGVEGNTGAVDGTGVVGLQDYSGSTAYPAAGVHGYTAGLGLGIGVLGEGNQGVYGNSGGLCGVCAVNQNSSGGAGLSASSPLTAIQASATGTSGQTYGVTINNASPNGTGLQATGGHTGVQAQTVAGGTNFFSDGTNSPAYGFSHTDNNNPGGGIGVYSNENCATCYGGVFINSAATNGGSAGAAMWVQGRLNVSVVGQSSFNGPAGTFVAGSGLSSFQFNDPYITATSLIFLTVATPGTTAVASVSNVQNGSATISFSQALGQNTTYQYLIVGQ
jgi:hypothetical protein